MSELDPRIARGTASMLAARAAAIAEGAVPLGWKAGFGAPAALAKLASDRPLVGYLTHDRLLPSGSSVDVASWKNPMLEAEVAAHLTADIGPGATAAGALTAVGGWSVAIELADVSSPAEDIEQILAGNIFHRHVVLGPVVGSLPSPLRISVRTQDEEVASTSDPEALTGALGVVLATMADTLAACGVGLRGGDVVITGSVVPPMPVENGSSWRVEADGLGRVGISLR